MCVSKELTVDDPVQPVRHGDVIQLIHGMTQRPLNRYLVTTLNSLGLSLTSKQSVFHAQTS